MLRTARLCLRPHSLADLETLCQLDTDEEARYFVGGVADRETTQRFLEKSIASFGKGDWKFAIDLRDTDEMIGWCWLKYLDALDSYEIGYQIARAHWGQGFATEAAARVIRFAFEDAGLEIIHALADPANKSSHRVLLKLGMKFRGNRIWDCPSGEVGLFAFEKTKSDLQ